MGKLLDFGSQRPAKVLVKKRRKIFTLSCSYSGSPGMDWHACVRFIEENQRFECWGNYDAEEPERLVGTCEEPLPNVEVRGIKGWQAEMLALCWTRFGEDQDRDYCPDFLSLSDSDLAWINFDPRTEWELLRENDLMVTPGWGNKTNSSGPAFSRVYPVASFSNEAISGKK